ncbi:hypothetical protein PGT21_017813 [Puccinia graminis f. sp. tritici]|uniref:non-specific serine/threonine protein kinase n=1 Tax=Puccinia graminis f. sp. tritici TaxID=56615 RepID=A0A5B0LKT2_PUCGR|nr:hypothetical protein PGT21_017813 [Puccinia graminis f. sp. tritici]
MPGSYGKEIGVQACTPTAGQSPLQQIGLQACTPIYFVRPLNWLQSIRRPSSLLGISTSQPYSCIGTPPHLPHHPGFQKAQHEQQAGSLGPAPLSPRIPSAVPGKNKAVVSIKDFDMLKSISQGAFGQVWLAKKKTTGDYYAIKILKKQDMIVKNQIMNRSSLPCHGIS